MKGKEEMNELNDVCVMSTSTPVFEEPDLRSVLRDAWVRWFPGIKEYQVSRVIDYQVDVMLPELANQWFAKPNEPMYLAWLDLRTKLGRITVNNRKEWVCSLMDKHPELSIVTVDFKGKEGRTTRCSFNHNYHRQIMDEITDLNKEFNPHSMSKIKNDTSLTQVRISIDPESLYGYVEATKEDLQSAYNSGKPERYIEVLVRNRTIAEYLISIAEADEDGAYLTEYYAQADSGRIYGKGFSLQRCPKMVRKAALGICYQYDFQASSYALMAGLAHSIDPDLKIPSVIGYVTDRSVIRKLIASDLGVSEDKIKEVFNSLGFGAGTHDNPHTSIRGSLTKEQYNKLMNHREFKHIDKEMTMIRDLVHKHYKGDFEFMGLQYCEVDPETSRKRNKNQKLAWMYQAMEANAISFLSQQIMASTVNSDRPDGIRPLLFCHDCVYYKSPLPVGDFDDAVYCLQKSNDVYKYLKIEETRVVPRSTHLQVKETDEYKQMMKEHLELMEMLNAKEPEVHPELKFYDDLISANGYFGDLGSEINTNKE